MSNELADLLFPSAPSVDNILAQYPSRSLSEYALITRFAPSPTGFVHIGSVYVALLDRILANQSHGVFILRIEDTDQKRKIENGVEEIITYLHRFGLEPDEGPLNALTLEEQGHHGPYLQSHRRSIYQAFAKELVARGKAYPSFQTEEELLALRKEQELSKSGIGYYGPWAKDRDLTLDQVRKKLDAATPFVIRIRAPFPCDEKLIVQDAIHGRLEIPANGIDHVLLKSDGLPTYHLAVVIDDVLMGVNLALRGDEWLGTLCLHVQLYQAFGFDQPTFAHIAPIGKQEGTTRRKLSKRKDPEANVAYYFEKGYPTQAIIAYLLNIADSKFTDWRIQNPTLPFTDYPLLLSNMSVSMALFDLQKLNSVSREIIAAYSEKLLVSYILEWAQEHNPQIAHWILADPDYARKAINIGRNDTPARKDLTVWSDVETEHGFFFDEYYALSVAKHGYKFPDLPVADMIAIFDYCLIDISELEARGKNLWLEEIKTFGQKNGFALSLRDYKNSPERYKGTFSQLMDVYRAGLTNKTNTPDLYQIIQIMGTERALARICKAQMWLREKSAHATRNSSQLGF